MKRKSIKGNIALLIIVIILLTANLVITLIVLLRPTPQIQCPTMKKSLPCESVPLNWAVDNYECANTLLRAMNVTNVKFLPPGTTEALRYNQTNGLLRNISR